MKRAKQIISALCYMGNTEGTGLTTVTEDNISDWLQYQFGYDENSELDGEIESGADYVYSYDDPLVVHVHYDEDYPTKPLIFDAVVKIGDMNIYLYKVE